MGRIVGLIVAAILAVIGIAFAANSWETVEPGHVKVPKLFGELQKETLTEPAWTNPFYDWVEFDGRLQSEDLENVSLFAQDQQRIEGDFSVQWRPNLANVHEIILEIGGMRELTDKVIVQGFRSACREASKTIKASEDFFKQEGQEAFQLAIMTQLQEYAGRHAIIERVLSKDLMPPETVQLAIEQKKKAEQEVEQQRAILERQRLEAQQMVEIATAKRQSAEQEAISIRTIAEARSFELEQRAKALENNPALIPYEYLQKWDGKLPTFMTDGSGLMLNMGIPK